MSVDSRNQVPVEGARPLPVPTEISKPYWEAAKRRELTFMHCRSCGHNFFPAAPACIACLSFDVAWERSAGRGVIDTFTVVEKEPSPGFPIPTILATINLDEGYYMFSDIVECTPGDVRCDMPVEVVFYDMTADITLPMFRPMAHA